MRQTDKKTTVEQKTDGAELILNEMRKVSLVKCLMLSLFIHFIVIGGTSFNYILQKTGLVKTEAPKNKEPAAEGNKKPEAQAAQSAKGKGQDKTQPKAKSTAPDETIKSTTTEAPTAARDSVSGKTKAKKPKRALSQIEKVITSKAAPKDILREPPKKLNLDDDSLDDAIK